MAPALSYCIVNTNGRDHLLACLDAIERTHPSALEAELLVLDNASDDGSVAVVREWIAAGGQLRSRTRLIEQAERTGKAQNDSDLLREAAAPYCLLLNEDSELMAGAADALVSALDASPRAAAAGAQLVSPDGVPQPCAWRLPGLATAVAGALFLHRLFTVQSVGGRVKSVGWVQSSAMLVRSSAAAEVGELDPEFFVYSDETDFCKRLRDAGWTTLYVPAATAVHHEQLSSDRRAGEPRVVEFHRGRDLYMRKHHGALAAAIARPLFAFPYLLRAAAALVLPGHDSRWYLLHARHALAPGRGAGLREAAAAYNRASSSRRSAS
jgi:N-acetylglucosaminyl-diphospho-decaprenol L-rhamnosyltransferase